MVRCKQCRVVLDIFPERNKKYRCLGCKTILTGNSYYRFPDKNAGAYSSSASSAKDSAFSPADIDFSADATQAPALDISLGDFTDFEVDETQAAATLPQGHGEDLDIDIFDDLSDMDFSAEPPTDSRREMRTLKEVAIENFAPYQILREVAQGGMGVIYEAKHPQYGKVALKLLPESEDIEDVDVHRFVREGEALKRLSHPNIIPFYESGVRENRHFIAMKFQEGETLNKIQERQGKFNPKKAAQLLIPLLSALDHAHSQEILHRDLKPENIIVDPHGIPHLMDFGIVKLMDENETKKLTAKGTTVGTPSYMPPEQAQGKKLTPACDIYSIGAILYEMLSDQCPFTGSNAIEIMKNVVHQPLKSLSSHGNFPDELIWICETALEKNPEARFQLAKEMEMTLQAYVDGKSLLAIKTMVPDRSMYSNRKNKFSGVQNSARSGSRVTASRVKGARGNRVAAPPPQVQKTSLLVPILLVLILVGGLGGGAYFFLSVKPQNNNSNEQFAGDPQGNGNSNSSSQNTGPSSEEIQQQQEEIQKHVEFYLRKGKSAEQDKDYQTALDSYGKVLAQDANNREALLRRCYCYYELGYVSDVDDLLDRYILKFEKDWEAHQLKAKCLKHKKNFISLINQLDLMKNHFPDRFKEILLMKAETYETMSKEPNGTSEHLNQAILTYENLLDQDPNNVKILTKLGTIYLNQLRQNPGSTEKAISYFKRAGDVDKETLEVQGNLGLAKMLSGQQEEGVSLLKKALQDELNVPKETRIIYLLNLIQFLNQKKDYKGVILYGKELNTLRPDPMIMSLIANAYVTKDDKEVRIARQWFKKARTTYRHQLNDAVSKSRGTGIPPMIQPPICLEQYASFLIVHNSSPSYKLAIQELQKAAEVYEMLGQFPKTQEVQALIQKYQNILDGKDPEEVKREAEQAAKQEEEDSSSEGKEELNELEGLLGGDDDDI